MPVSRASLALVLATLAPLPAAAAPVAGVAKHPRHRHVRRAHRRRHRRRTLAVRGGSITLTFTTAAWTKLSRSSAGTGTGSSTGTTPIAPATASGATFTFPITGGSLNAASGRGALAASGGIEVSSSGTSSFVTTSTSGSAVDPLITLGATPTVTVTSENFTPPTVTLLGLATAGVRPYASGNEVLISDIPATVTSAAQQLFGIAGPFNVGEEIATLTVRAER